MPNTQEYTARGMKSTKKMEHIVIIPLIVAERPHNTVLFMKWQSPKSPTAGRAKMPVMPIIDTNNDTVDLLIPNESPFTGV